MRKACGSCGRDFEPRHDLETICGACRNVPTDPSPSIAVKDGPEDKRGPLRAAADGIKSGSARLLASNPMTHNRVYRANLSGGIIGWLGTSSKRALQQVCRDANAEGQEVVFISMDTLNFLQYFIYTAILLLTLFLWCPAPGYLVVTRPRSQE